MSNNDDLLSSIEELTSELHRSMLYQVDLYMKAYPGSDPGVAKERFILGKLASIMVGMKINLERLKQVEERISP